MNNQRSNERCYDYLTIVEIAEDLQRTRDFPNITHMMNSGYLKSYSRYETSSRQLTMSRWRDALEEGFSQAMS